jgi:hypothetical protein
MARPRDNHLSRHRAPHRLGPDGGRPDRRSPQTHTATQPSQPAQPIGEHAITKNTPDTIARAGRPDAELVAEAHRNGVTFTVAGDARTGARRSETVELGLGDAADVARFLVEALHDAAIADDLFEGKGE